MHSRLILSLAFLAALLSGCGNEESSSGGSGKPPANMCEAVAPAVPEDWELTESSPGGGKAKTDCTLADETGRTTLVVTVQKPKSGTSVDEAFKQLCDTYIGSPPEGDECTKDGPVELEGSPAELQRGVRLDGSAGVLWMSFQTSDPDKAAEADDVLDEVEDAISKD
jgi:hypothetical protein